MKAPFSRRPQSPRFALFSDLDGTLIDFHSYQPTDEARAALRALEAAGVAVVPVSSKTAAEVAPLMAELGLTGPAVTEGGAVVLGESGRQSLIGPPRAALLEVLREMQRLALPVRGMSQMTVEEVCSRTGLTAAAAARAMQRSGSEPFVALGELGTRELELMRETAGAHGAEIARGGRFWHLLGAGVDKGTAVAALCDSWPAGRPEATAAVGDAWNDLPMLERVDLGFLLGDAVEAAAVPAGVQRIASPGPQGFVEAVRRLQRAWGLGAAEE